MVERVHAMEQVVASAHAVIARVADYMSRYANCHRRDLAIDAGSFAWLSEENLSFHPGLTGKLAAKFDRLFKFLNRLIRLFFVWSCQNPGVCTLFFMFLS